MFNNDVNSSIYKYFISLIVWIADIGKVSVNVTLMIAFIINFNF